MVGHPVTIMGAPENVPLLRSTLAEVKLDAETIFSDLNEYNWSNFVVFILNMALLMHLDRILLSI